jgi:hypothetical protein
MFNKKRIMILEQKVILLEKELTEIKRNYDPVEMEKVKLHLLSLRGIVNKKLGQKIDAEEKPEEEQDINTKKYY